VISLIIIYSLSSIMLISVIAISYNIQILNFHPISIILSTSNIIIESSIIISSPSIIQPLIIYYVSIIIIVSIITSIISSTI